MSNIAKSATDLIGNTPLLELPKTRRMPTSSPNWNISTRPAVSRTALPKP